MAGVIKPARPRLARDGQTLYTLILDAEKTRFIYDGV